MIKHITVFNLYDICVICEEESSFADTNASLPKGICSNVFLE